MALPRLPRFGRRQVTWTTAVLTSVALAAGPVLLPASADDLDEKKKKAHQQVQAAEADLEDSSAALVAATRKLRAAQSSLVSAQAKLAKTQGELTAARVLDAQMQAKMVAAQAALKAAVAEVKAGEQKVAEQKDALAQAAVASFSYGDPNLMKLSVLLKGTDPSDMVLQLNALDNLLDAENDLLDEYKANQALLVVQRDRVESAKAAVAQQRRAAAANLARKKKLEQQAAAVQRQVAALVSSRAQLARAAAAARAADRRKLEASKKRERRIQRLILERSRNQNNGNYNGASNGFLAKPVPGWITSRYGYRVHPIYGYYSLHDGNDYHAPCGSSLQAAASGRVISEYYSDVWGNRLYLDVGKVNGRRMTLIYNHISSYKARTGDKVARGETIAYAGTTGWSTGCHLHFTVLVDGNPVDPNKYL